MGKNRITTDLDFTVSINFKDDKICIKEIIEYLNPRRPDASGFDLSRRVLLVEMDYEAPANLFLGGLPFEEGMINNNSYFKYLEGLE